ncbi:MAG: Txe/YoeB family addiction module toxin [Clostridiales bacterium]|nr:Txe/YoeB family addiction module toxin [Clostridiales bacterium]
MIKSWTDKAWDDFNEWVIPDKKALKKITNLLKSIDRDGYNCIGHPEPLKHALSGYWSVAIDKKNRLVFRIENDEIIKIIQCGTHYGDK